MAVWGLHLLPYTIEDTINTTRRLPPRINRNDGTGVRYTHRTSGRRFNSTILNSTSTTTMPVLIDVYGPENNASSTTPLNSYSATSKPSTYRQRGNSTHSRQAKIVKQTPAKRKSGTDTVTRKPKNRIRGNNTKYITQSEKDLLPKSNMQVLQFYAQPLQSIELKAQPIPTYSNGGSNGVLRELPVMIKPPAHSLTALSHSQVYMAPSSFTNAMSPMNHMSYKTIPEEFTSNADSIPKTLAFKPINYNVNVGLERPALNPLPILEPLNVYKQNPRTKTLPVMPVQPQKFVATIRPVASSLPAIPPVSVTRVYKYTDDSAPAFNLPFLDGEDPIEENLPILSAALDDRLNDRVASLSIRNYMTPPKVSQPIIYGAGVHPTAAYPNAYRNEFQILNKFNKNLRTQVGFPAQNPDTFETEDDVEGERENYSEEEVKKALKYIQRLKKDKPGRAAFRNSEQHYRKNKGKRRGKNKKDALEEDVLDDDIEPEQSSKKKHRKGKYDPFKISDDDDEDEIEDTPFQVKSFVDDADRNQEESQTKSVKAEAEGKPRSLELREVPKVNQEVCELPYVRLHE